MRADSLTNRKSSVALLAFDVTECVALNEAQLLKFALDSISKTTGANVARRLGKDEFECYHEKRECCQPG
jgi:hypothetical protein